MRTDNVWASCQAVYTHKTIISIREGKTLKFTEKKAIRSMSHRRVKAWTQVCLTPKLMTNFLFLRTQVMPKCPKPMPHFIFLPFSSFSLKNDHFIYSVSETHHFLIPQNMRTRRYLRYNNSIIYTLKTRNDNWMTCPRSEECLSEQTGNRCSDSLASCPTWQHVASLAACSSSLCGETISHHSMMVAWWFGVFRHCIDSTLGLPLIYVGQPCNILV